MTTGTISSANRVLHETIRTLCPLIADKVQEAQAKVWSEFDLRRELVSCVLGSQVRYEMAVAAALNLEEAGLLDDRWWLACDAVGFEQAVFEVLDGRAPTSLSPTRYRFAKSRSHQLEGARVALAHIPLNARLSDGQDPRAVRSNLVADIPGIGPKQASMFLRNIGRSYDLAILDTHVLRFICTQDLCGEDDILVGTFRGYERAERVLVNYAESIGYPAGYLDWAIWATMKAAGELGL
jgi:N-glycosylase/DNA lyase